MENKITSYTLSKRLDELGFDCESHTGLWREYVNYHLPEYVSNYGETEIDFSKGYDRSIKAYDCHDLLMWLRVNKPLCSLYIGTETFNIQFADSFKPDSDHPQEALAQAVLKILGEKE